MKKINLLICSGLILITQLAHAQQNDARQPAFHSLNYVGLLNGSYSSALQLESIEGMGYKNWFAGIGAGLDYYRYRTVPLFLDLRHYFGKTQNKFFVYADAGNVFPWLTKKEKNPFAGEDKFKGEGYYDLGGGYQLSLSKRHALLISAGYSQLKLKELIRPYYFSPQLFQNSTAGPYVLQLDRLSYTLNRLSLKIGITL